MSATKIARNFAEVLDAVEQRGEQITIVRRGKAVAVITPIEIDKKGSLKAARKRVPGDGSLRRELKAMSDLVPLEG